MTTHRIGVLDKGYIELVEVMGNDLTVVNAARVSFARESQELTSDDRRLINYLARHKHVSPFYHPHLMFRVKAPISVQRQWYKHKIGTAENSESTRYIEVNEEFYVPSTMREQSISNKQGSAGEMSSVESEYAKNLYLEACKVAFDRYRSMVRLGVAKEQAREVLPLCTYTTWVWTASLAAVAHFIELRDDPHAQEEIRQYALALRVLALEHFPVSLGALCSVHSESYRVKPSRI